MPTEIRVFDSWEEARAATGLAPGSMWRDPDMDREGREAWAVVLPNGALWYTTDTADGHDGFGWEVTGTPPRITVNPSIDDADPHNPWHGWIRDGVMTP